MKSKSLIFSMGIPMLCGSVFATEEVAKKNMIPVVSCHVSAEIDGMGLKTLSFNGKNECFCPIQASTRTQWTYEGGYFLGKKSDISVESGQEKEHIFVKTRGFGAEISIDTEAGRMIILGKDEKFQRVLICGPKGTTSMEELGQDRNSHKKVIKYLLPGGLWGSLKLVGEIILQDGEIIRVTIKGKNNSQHRLHVNGTVKCHCQAGAFNLGQIDRDLPPDEEVCIASINDPFKAGKGIRSGVRENVVRFTLQDKNLSDNKSTVSYEDGDEALKAISDELGQGESANFNFRYVVSRPSI